MEPHLHRIEVEDAVALDDDLAVERRQRREQLLERPQLREVAKQGTCVARPEPQLARSAVLEQAAEPSHFGSYCHSSPSGSSRTSSASIGGNGIDMQVGGRSTGSRGPMRGSRHRSSYYALGLVRRVVVTGLGAVTRSGSMRSRRGGAVAGRSGVDWIRAFDASEFPFGSRPR